jgi:hypothetical protein
MKLRFGCLCGRIAAHLILKSTVGLPNSALLPAIGIAAGSQAGADYVTHRYLENATGGFIF